MIGLPAHCKLHFWQVAGRVFVIDVDETRLELARKLGATDTFNSSNAGFIAEIRRLTSGRGADIAFECVGISPTVNLATEVVRKGGMVTLVGNVAPTVEIGLQSTVTRQIRLQGSCASSGRISGFHFAHFTRSDSCRATPLRSGSA